MKRNESSLVVFLSCVDGSTSSALVDDIASEYSRKYGFVVRLGAWGRRFEEVESRIADLKKDELEGWLDLDARGYGSIEAPEAADVPAIVGLCSNVADVVIWESAPEAVWKLGDCIVIHVSSDAAAFAKAEKIVERCIKDCIPADRMLLAVDGADADVVIRNSSERWGIKGVVARVLANGIAARGAEPEENPKADFSDYGVVRQSLKKEILDRLLDVIDVKKIGSAMGSSAVEAARAEAKAAAAKLVARIGSSDLPPDERDAFVQEIVDEAVGLGPVERLMRDDSITEIMVNGLRGIYVERRGRLELTRLRFASDRQLMTVVERIVAPIGRRVDERNPYVDARLGDGSRVNVILPPLSLNGPAITIRKFSRDMKSLDDLMRAGSLTLNMAEFLSACVRARINIVVSGGTGTGKTTLLNALSAFIDAGERIVTIEDSSELKLNQPHVVRLESRPKNIEGEGEVTIRDLVRNALRMRPDRIIVGECRGGEALDMLQAMNTGHDGSITTVHANNARDVISRLETMALFAGIELPVRVVREQVARAIDLIVHLGRFSDGRRRIVGIHEVVGMEGETVVMQDLVNYENGDFVPTGFAPAFFKRSGSQKLNFPRLNR